MIKLITGKKGTGKTKILVDMINNAVKDTNGDLICIEKGAKLTYDISYKVRLVDSDRFAIEGYEAFYGFIAGMFAGNYDIKEIFIDGILKIGFPATIPRSFSPSPQTTMSCRRALCSLCDTFLKNPIDKLCAILYNIDCDAQKRTEHHDISTQTTVSPGRRYTAGGL